MVLRVRARRGGVLDELAARARRRLRQRDDRRARARGHRRPRRSPTRGARRRSRCASRATTRGKALDLLRSLGLPRDRRHGFAEVYGQPSLIPTPSEERARYLEALGGEIERTLETADGVVSARVHLVLEETDPLAVDAKPRTAARAAVLLKVRGGRAPLPDGDVQKLVAGSVPGLDPAAVAVVVTRAPDSRRGAEGSLARARPAARRQRQPPAADRGDRRRAGGAGADGGVAAAHGRRLAALQGAAARRNAE